VSEAFKETLRFHVEWTGNALTGTPIGYDEVEVRTKHWLLGKDIIPTIKEMLSKLYETPNVWTIGEYESRLAEDNTRIGDQEEENPDPEEG
jgi:hypothetical protein